MGKKKKEQATGAATYVDIPDEVWLYIFSFLFMEDLFSVTAVCRLFRAVSRDNNLANNYRRNVNVSIIGSCGAGKSTLAGHLLMLLHEAAQVDIKNATEAAELVKDTRPYAKFAFLASRRVDDRTVGVTTDNNFLHIVGSSHPVSVTLIDTPGHRDFFKNTLRGFMQSDMAIWVVNEMPPQGVPYGRDQFFYEAPLLISGSNMRCALVVVNKVDEREWSTARFDEIKIKLAQVLVKRHIKTENIIIVPVSAVHGWNITHRSLPPPGDERKDDIRLTYQGPTMWEALIKLALRTPERPMKRPFRMSVVKMWNVQSNPKEPKRGLILGTVLQGGLKAGQRIQLSPVPAGFEDRGDIQVESIFSGKQKRYLAPPGHLVALLLHPRSLVPTRPDVGQDGTGWMAYNSKREAPASFTAETRCFIVQVMMFTGKGINPALSPTNKFEIKKGYTPVFHFLGGCFRARVAAIHNALDMKTKKVVEENPKSATGGSGKLFTMTILSRAGHTIEAFNKSKTMGRFLISDNQALAAAGIVVATVPGRPTDRFVDARATDRAHFSYPLDSKCALCAPSEFCVNYAGPPGIITYNKVPLPVPKKMQNSTRQQTKACVDCFFAEFTKNSAIIENAYCATSF